MVNFLKWFKRSVSIANSDYIVVNDIKIFPEDVEIIKLIRKTVIVERRPFVIKPPAIVEIINSMAYNNAKEMIKVGMSQQEVLEATGFWIEKE